MLTLSLGCNTLCYKFDQYRVNARGQNKTILQGAKIKQIGAGTVKT